MNWLGNLLLLIFSSFPWGYKKPFYPFADGPKFTSTHNKKKTIESLLSTCQWTS